MIILGSKISKFSQFLFGVILGNIYLSAPVFGETSDAIIRQIEAHKNTDFSLTQNHLTQGAISPPPDVLLEALEVADTIEDAEIKAGMLIEIAGKYAQIGDREIALDLLSEALELTDTLEETEVKATVLNAIAINYVALEQFSLAQDTLSLALAEINALEESEKKASLLAEIALNYAAIGEAQISSQLLSESQEVVAAALAPPVYFPLEPTPWQGSLSLGISLNSDSSTTGVATLIGTLERTWPRNEFYTQLGLTSNFDDSRASDDQNRVSGYLTANYKYHFSERWQYFFNSYVWRDDANDVDFRSSLATGVGINLWRAGSARSLDMQLGVGVGFESSERDTEEVDFPLIQYRIFYRDLFFDSLAFRQSFTFEVPANNADDYFIQSSTTISVPLSQQWALDNSLIFEYFALPLENNPNLEMQLRTGLQYSF